MGNYKPGPEKQLQTEVLRYLEILGIFSWAHKNTGTFDPIKQIFRRNTTRKGVPDVLGVIPKDGRILAIELKSKTGRLSPEQKIFLERIVKDGGIAGVARSLDDVKEILRSSGCFHT